ncbi:MarR family EPS-associated transcriptional regulator [Sulfitobacter aestuarii]|uniref:MarR family EPS-associated transcriptional regulator n=1 Tax=Sulfitobacter aestuarii TaxID=2161676 RepID=A0ABW5U918_9RHOB
MTRDINEDTRFRLMRALEGDPALSQRALAAELGLSLGMVNYCLRALVDRGQVKIRNFRAADNKRRYAYVLTPSGLAAKARLTRDFLKRRMAEHEALRAEIEALQRELGSGGADRSKRPS